MLRIKGARRGGDLPRTPEGSLVEAGFPLTAQFPALFEALGLNYHHLDANISKAIVPGPTRAGSTRTSKASSGTAVEHSCVA